MNDIKISQPSEDLSEMVSIPPKMIEKWLAIPGMEARLAAIESKTIAAENTLIQVQGKTESSKAALDEMKIELAILKERISHAPSKAWMMTILIIFFIALGGMIVFQDRLQMLFNQTSSIL